MISFPNLASSSVTGKIYYFRRSSTSMCSEDELVALIPFPNLASSRVTGRFNISGEARIT